MNISMLKTNSTKSTRFHLKAIWNEKKIGYRLQQLLVLILHLALLKWMLYALYEGGSLPLSEVMAHFFGMAVYGGCLIMGTATWAKYHHRRDMEEMRSA